MLGNTVVTVVFLLHLSISHKGNKGAHSWALPQDQALGDTVVIFLQDVPSKQLFAAAHYESWFHVMHKVLACENCIVTIAVMVVSGLFFLM